MGRARVIGMSSGEGGGGKSRQTPVDALGAFIRVQRQLAHMSLREMAALTSVSNAYLSQIERGLHQPSLRVLRSIAQALGITPEELLRRADFLSPSGDADDANAAGPGACPAGATDTGRGAAGPDAGPPVTEVAIATDPKLTPRQREALLNVYRSFRDSG